MDCAASVSVVAQGRLPSSRLCLPLQRRSPRTEAGKLEATPRMRRRKIDRGTSRHISEQEIEAEMAIACMLSKGQWAESTAEGLQSMARPRKGPMLCHHCR